MANAIYEKLKSIWNYGIRGYRFSGVWLWWTMGILLLAIWMFLGQEMGKISRSTFGISPESFNIIYFAFALLVPLSVQILYLFTRALDKDEGEVEEELDAELKEEKPEIESDLHRIRPIFRFAYGFTIMALVISFLPFLLLPNSESAEDFMLESPIGVLQGCSYESDPVRPVPAETKCRDDPNQWVVNIGGAVVKKGGKKTIHGGLVVPLYFIILSMMGAAVSMMRRVPEYQRRVTNSYRKEWDIDKTLPRHMTPQHVRESVIFQILQVFSAPLIAVVAYFLVNPDERATTIVLGFAVGFSSEAILQLIRKLTNQIAEIGASKPAAPASSPPAAPASSPPASLSGGTSGRGRRSGP